MSGDTGQLAPEQVAAWLESPEGEQWARATFRPPDRLVLDEGVFSEGVFGEFRRLPLGTKARWKPQAGAL